MVFIKFDIYKKMVNFVNKIKYWIKGGWELGEWDYLYYIIIKLVIECFRIIMKRVL